VAHFPGKQLVALLDLLAPGNVKKDAEHGLADDVRVVALATGGDPADLAVNHDAEVNLIRPHKGARRRERRPDPIPVGGMDVARQVLERDCHVPG